MSDEFSFRNPAPETVNPFLLDDVIRVSPNNVPARVFKGAVEKALGLRYLANEYINLPPSDSPRTFVQQTFATLGIKSVISEGSLENIPASGAVIIVANHPFGAVEGMLMAELLLKYRDDVRIMANSFLKRIPELSDLFIGVNPYGSQKAKKDNFSAMREGMNWLKNGGVLVMFPAGDVSSVNLRHMGITEGEWDSSVARMAVRSGATVVPMHFSGRNSSLFYLFSLINPLLKTVMLPRQLINKRGKTIQVRIGKAIKSKRLLKIKNDKDCAAYLRLRTYLLAQQKETGRSYLSLENDANMQVEPIIEPIQTELLETELLRLQEKQKLLLSGKYEVFYAHAEQIPWILREIGRLREESFRAVGEGTGNSLDVDLYDSYYTQLFIWDKEEKKIVGGYRLGFVDEIIKKFGRSGLYSYSLFKFKRSFLYNIKPGIELGRSFVRQEYQRSFAPLMLLWKGIGHLVAAKPGYATLFGPVSISDDYCSTSQKLLINFLRLNEFDSSLSKKLRPRSPYPSHVSKRLSRTQLAGLKNLDELSELLADIEVDNKGVPVLIRQYLKLGGRMLGFNIDAGFNDAVDGLIYVDLRETDPRILSKYMGAEGTERFLRWHSEASSKTG